METKYLLISIQLLFIISVGAQVNIEFDLCETSIKKRGACVKFDANCKLSNGKNFVVKGYPITVDKYKHDLQIISPNNKILKRRTLEDTLIFNSSALNDNIRLFYTEKSGSLTVEEIDSNLEFKGDPHKLLDLIPRKNNTGKIHNYNYPEIVFSNDFLYFAVIENYSERKSKKNTIRVSLFNDQLKLLKTDLIYTGLGRAGFINQSILVNNNGVVFISGHSYFTSDYFVFSVNTDSTYTKIFQHGDLQITQEKEIFSKLFFNNKNEISCIKTVLDKKNNIKKTEFLSFSDDLNMSNQTETDILSSNIQIDKYRGYDFINTRNIELMPDGSIIFVAEYDTYSRYYNSLITKPPYSIGDLIVFQFNVDNECSLFNVLHKKHLGVLAENMGVLTKIVNNDIYFFYAEKAIAGRDNFMVSKLNLVTNKFSNSILYDTKEIPGPIFYNNRINEGSFIGRPYNLVRDVNYINIDEKSLIYFTRNASKMVKISIVE